MVIKDERGYDLFLLFSQGWTNKEIYGQLGYPKWIVWAWHSRYREAHKRIKKRILTATARAQKNTHVGH